MINNYENKSDKKRNSYQLTTNWMKVAPSTNMQWVPCLVWWLYLYSTFIRIRTRPYGLLQALSIEAPLWVYAPKLASFPSTSGDSPWQLSSLLSSFNSLKFPYMNAYFTPHYQIKITASATTMKTLLIALSNFTASLLFSPILLHGSSHRQKWYSRPISEKLNVSPSVHSLILSCASQMVPSRRTELVSVSL